MNATNAQRRAPLFQRLRKAIFNETLEPEMLSIVPKQVSGSVHKRAGEDPSNDPLIEIATFAALGLLISLLALMAGWPFELAS